MAYIDNLFLITKGTYEEHLEKLDLLFACPVGAQAKEPQDPYHKGTYVHRVSTKGNAEFRMRPTMARPPPEPPPPSTITNDKEHRHVDTQENNKKHKENSITKHYSRKQSKKKNHRRMETRVSTQPNKAGVKTTNNSKSRADQSDFCR
eukprot:15364912-Ditylum_brightwellii.AAC.1